MMGKFPIKGGQLDASLVLSRSVCALMLVRAISTVFLKYVIRYI